MRDTRIATDIGGTFTDVVGFDERTGEVRYGKTLTVPGDLVQGMLTGIEKAGSKLSRARLFLHGTTLVINALLERRGAVTALITTRGFRDVYEIGRINRHDSYNLFFRKHVPLIPRSLRFEVTERLSAKGEVLTPLDDEEVAQIADRILELDVEAVAVMLLHSYVNPAHEQRVVEMLRQRRPGLFITPSHALSKEYREYERTSTVAANAYVGPTVKAYLGNIDQRLREEQFDGRFLVVQSSGGLFDAGDAQRECIRLLESGPAAGVIGTKAVCERLSLPDAIAFDMGGTTAKAGVVANYSEMLSGCIMVGGYDEGVPIQIPLIDIHEVGTGGGSIARVAVGGGLRARPDSPGAVPGPVCYGRGGTEPTVTDANLVLGRLAPDRFLGGEMPLDLQAATSALDERVARKLAMDVVRAADGIVRVAVIAMAHVVTRATSERGLDASDFAMVAYGGAGPLHACLVAKELRIGTVIIPAAPGHFSAYGMLVANLRRDFVRTWFQSLADASFEEMEALYRDMEAEGRSTLDRNVGQGESVRVRRAADMGYEGQEHAVTVELDLSLFSREDRAGIKKSFDEEHRKRYGYAAERERAEIVSLHCSIIGDLKKPELRKVPALTADPRGSQPRTRPAYFGEVHGFVECPVYDRDRLGRGDSIEGPALIEEHASTTVLFPHDRLTVGDYGDLIIQIRRS